MNISSNSRAGFQWLALYLVQGLGNIGAHCLLKAFSDPANIFDARVADLTSVDGINETVARNIVSRKFALDPEEEMKRIERAEGRIIPFHSPEYPALLKEIHDPPVILYAKGKTIPYESTFVAIVGSRNPTHYGRKVAAEIARDIAGAGLGVVSGMARGIDGAAHWGCLKGKGFTIGVVGTGLDVIYPRVNKKLFEAVWEQGTVITEFPMRTPPEPRHFPIRNRIISGMAKGVVVVEATRRSGSLITAGQALEQGRDVFAVPGSVFSPKSGGTHYLIKQGAKLVERAEDVLEEIYPERSLGGLMSGEHLLKAHEDMTELEEKIYELLADYPKHIDELVRELNLDAGQLSAILLNLELYGLVKQLPGKMFVRA